MHTFAAPDGTELAYHETGTGDPLVCIPGGPMWASGYLGDLGGLSAHRRLVRLDLRGTGASAVPADPSSYRCDRLTGDVEALREHLGLDRLDLLGHSAGASVAVRYATAHPDRVGRLVLTTPSLRSVGIDVTWDDRRTLALRRRAEPWFPPAFAALETLQAGAGTAEQWQAVAPFFHGSWDAAAQRLSASRAQQSNEDAAAVFVADGAFDPAATRAALAGFAAPTLLLAGEFDMNSPPPAVAEFAALFPAATLVVQPGAGHYPWQDDAGRFVASVAGFLH